MLRRAGPAVLGISVLGSGLVYLLAGRAAPQYESSSSVAALSAEVGNSLISSTLVSAPPLPQSVVESALRSPSVLQKTLRQIAASDLSADQKQRISATLQEEAGSQRYKQLQLSSRIDPQQQTGIYELRGLAQSPRAAQVLVGASTQALLQWDRERAAQNIVQAQRTLQVQLANLDTRLSVQVPGSLTERSLLSNRADLQEKLGQISALLTAYGGTLSLVSEASLPQQPVSPKPLRDAALTFLGLLFFTALLAFLLDAFRKRVNTAADLRHTNLPVLGVLPRLRRDSLGLLSEARSGAVYEDLGFLRVNLASVAGGRSAFVVSSAQPGEGKSSVTAALAQSFALNGQRVLIIDGDAYRPTQLQLWQQDTGQLPVAQPHNGGLLYSDVVPLLDLLIPEKVGSDSTHLSLVVRELESFYSVILVDMPPLLVAASTPELAAHLGGLVVVVAAGGEVELLGNALETANSAKISLVGLILNKAQVGNSHAYTDYTATSPAKVKVSS